MLGGNPAMDQLPVKGGGGWVTILNTTHFLLYHSPSIQILPCKNGFCLLLFYRSEEEDFENFMRAFFGQFNPPREERNQGSNKQPKKRKRKKR